MECAAAGTDCIRVHPVVAQLMRGLLLSAGFGVGAAPLHAQDALRVMTGQPSLSARGDEFGHAIALAGDLDGDGVDEVVVGARYEDRLRRTPDGAVYVFSGATGAELRSHVGARAESLGSYVTAGGDFDGDGVGDYAAMADASLGIAYLWSGASGALIRSITASGSDRFTGGLFVVPDLDRDGAADLGVAGSSFTATGWENRLFLYSGRSGARLIDYLGLSPPGIGEVRSVARLADMTGDGVEEFAVGYDNGWGSVDIVDGVLQSPIVTLDGEPGVGGAFGGSCGRLGDLDGDGIDDFAIADREWNGSGAVGEAGRVYVYTGATFRSLFTIDSPDTASGPNFGLVPADGRFDFDGDGWPDIASGSGGWSIVPTGFNYSIATVFSGRTGRLLYQWNGGPYVGFGDEHLGWSLAVADLDRDGRGELIAGAPLGWTAPKSGGVVRAYAGNDLLLQANDTIFIAGDSIEVATRGGEPGELTLLAVVAIDGVPTFEEVALTTLDAAGESPLSDIVPSGLTGITFTIEALATRSTRRGLEVSSRVVLEFQ